MRQQEVQKPAPAPTGALDDLDVFRAKHNGPQNADAVIVINKSEKAVSVDVAIRGSETTGASAFVTTDVKFDDRNYQPLGRIDVQNGRLKYEAPARSVTTLYFA